MPMDMPPQQVVEYRIAPARAEAPKSIHAQVARFLGAERIRAEEKSGITIGSFDAAQKLPPMDFSSTKLKETERLAISKVLDASQRGVMGSVSVDMPDGYVARRMAAAVMTARIAERSQAGGRVTAKQIDAVRCSLVAVVMDPRAADYVKGGERTAAASRAALTAGDVELCQPTLVAQAARLSGQRTSIDPAVTRMPAVMTSVSPVSHRTPSVGVSPHGSMRISIDPTPSKRTSISPTGSKAPVSVTPKGSERTSISPTGSKGIVVARPKDLQERLAIVNRVLGIHASGR